MALGRKIFEGDVLHAGVGGVAVCANCEGLTDDFFGGVAEAGLRETHALGERGEEPDVGAGLAERLDGLL